MYPQLFSFIPKRANSMNGSCAKLVDLVSDIGIGICYIEKEQQKVHITLSHGPTINEDIILGQETTISKTFNLLQYTQAQRVIPNKEDTVRKLISQQITLYCKTTKTYQRVKHIVISSTRTGDCKNVNTTSTHLSNSYVCLQIIKHFTKKKAQNYFKLRVGSAKIMD